MSTGNQAPEGAPAGWPSGIDIADEIDSLLPASMGYSTRAAVEQWWRDLVARKLSKLAAPSPAEGDEDEEPPLQARMAAALREIAKPLAKGSKSIVERAADMLDAQPDVQPKGTPAGYALIHEDALRAWGKLDEVRAACVYPVAAPSVPSPAVGEPTERRVTTEHTTGGA